MIRIAHLSDSHFDERGRLDDVIAVHRAFLDQVSVGHVDAIVHAGDWFERRSTPAERMAVAEFLRDAALVAPVFGVKGNHDQAGDLDIFNLLDAPGVVKIVDAPSTAPGSAASLEPDLPIRFLALPWFDKAHLVAGLDPSLDAEQTRQLAIEAARKLLGHVGAEARRVRNAGGIPILVGHLMVSGSEVSTGQVIQGTTVELSPADLLDVGAAYVALGHVHKPQEWFEGRVAYSGSPHRCNFGEPEAKGWRLVTLTDEGEFVSNEFRELPARRMVLLEADWSEGEGRHRLRVRGIEPTCFALGQVSPGDLVRFRYRVSAQDLHIVDESLIRKAFLADGAHEVKVEAVVVTEARVRSEEIVRSTTTAEKMDAFFAAKQITVDEQQHARLVAKLETLEGEAGGSRAAA